MDSRLAIVGLGLMSLAPGLTGCGAETGTQAPDPAAAAAVTRGAESVMPAPRAGADRLGAELPRGLDRGLDSSGRAPRATLHRWWTDRCPYCVASLPAIEELRLAFADRGLETIAVFHPKPPMRPGEVPLETIREVAAARGYHGRVASDLDWSLLRALWLDTGSRGATSASFLSDADGVVRFVHPGPELHRSTDPDHELCNADFGALEQAIEALLSQ